MGAVRKMLMRVGAVLGATSIVVAMSASGATAAGKKCERSYGVQRCAELYQAKYPDGRKAAGFLVEGIDLTNTSAVKIRKITLHAQEKRNGVWTTMFGQIVGANQTRSVAAMLTPCNGLASGRKLRAVGVVKWRDHKGVTRIDKVTSKAVWKGSVC